MIHTRRCYIWTIICEHFNSINRDDNVCAQQSMCGHTYWECRRGRHIVGITRDCAPLILCRPIIIILPLYAFHLWNVAFVVFFVVDTRVWVYSHVLVYNKNISLCMCVATDDCESAASSFIKRIVLSARASVVVGTLRRLDVGFHKRKKKTQNKKQHISTYSYIPLHKSTLWAKPVNIHFPPWAATTANQEHNKLSKINYHQHLASKQQYSKRTELIHLKWNIQIKHVIMPLIISNIKI